MSVLDNLFNDGEYYHILVNIFNYLDGASLEACHLVSKQWRAFLWSYTTSAKVRERLKQSLRTGVATTRRVKLSEKISSFKCDNTSLLVGKSFAQFTIQMDCKLHFSIVRNGHSCLGRDGTTRKKMFRRKSHQNQLKYSPELQKNHGSASLNQPFLSYLILNFTL